jgi:hypothetical protein
MQPRKPRLRLLLIFLSPGTSGERRAASVMNAIAPFAARPISSHFFALLAFQTASISKNSICVLAL